MEKRLCTFLLTLFPQVHGRSGLWQGVGRESINVRTWKLNPLLTRVQTDDEPLFESHRLIRKYHVSVYGKSG